MASSTLTRRQIIGRLTSNTEKRRRLKEAEEELLEERDSLYVAAREADPPITVREIAELAGLTEVAVNKRLGQLRRQD